MWWNNLMAFCVDVPFRDMSLPVHERKACVKAQKVLTTGEQQKGHKQEEPLSMLPPFVVGSKCVGYSPMVHHQQPFSRSAQRESTCLSQRSSIQRNHTCLIGNLIDRPLTTTLPRGRIFKWRWHLCPCWKKKPRNHTVVIFWAAWWGSRRS